MTYHSTPRSDMPVAFALVGADGRIAAVNDAFAKLLGYAPAELCARAVDGLVFAPDLEQAADNSERLFAGAIDGYQATQRYKHRDGGLMKLQLQVSAATDAAGAVLFAVLHARTQVEAPDLATFPQVDHASDEVEKIKRAMFW